MDTQMQWEFSWKCWSYPLDIKGRKLIFLLYLLMTPTYRNRTGVDRKYKYYSVHTYHAGFYKTWKKISFNTNSKDWGSWIDSTNICISISEEKAEHLILKIRRFLSIPAPTIWQLSSIIRSVISLFSATSIGRLHYRVLEREKISLLRKAGGNFDVQINSLNEFVKDELNW